MRYSGPAAHDERAIPVFSPTIDVATELLQSLPPAEAIAADTILLQQGERPTHVRLIRSGIIRIKFVREDGQEHVLGLRSAGWWAGAPLALMDMPSMYTAETITPCMVNTIPTEEFSQQLWRNQRVLRHFISSQCREVMVGQQHAIMQSSSASERLQYLRREQQDSAWQTVDPSSVMNQGELAKLMAMTPEHLSRLMKIDQQQRTAAIKANAEPEKVDLRDLVKRKVVAA